MASIQAKATPIKLRNGEWGARVTHLPGHAPNPGDTITVRTNAGKSWQSVVRRIVWQDSPLKGGINAKITLVSTTRADSPG